jgi:pilus assembly protein CpaF
VELISRLAQLVLDSDVPLRRADVVAAVQGLLPTEAPLAPATTPTEVADALVGLGPLEPLLRQPDVSDVLVNGDGSVWVERGGVLERGHVDVVPPGVLVAAVERVIAPLGLRLDRASPAVDARLPDGSRLHALIPPVSVGGPLVAVRRFTEAVHDLDELVASGALDEAAAQILRDAVRRRHSILVSGGTGAGKTTLLNVLSKEIPVDERVVTVEDAAELKLSGHVVRLETRPANTEGVGAVAMQDLIRHALRLRPDRIIVGEVRGPEALDMIQAMSTGHDGSMSTVHANSPGEALLRVETLALGGDRRVGEETIRRQLFAALDLVVQVDRVSGLRRVRSIATVNDGAVAPIWEAP